MFTIDNTNTDFSKFLAGMAESMHTKVIRNTVIIPEAIGNGYFKSFTLSNGLQCLLYDFKLSKELYLQQKKCNKEFYILRFDDVAITESLMLKIDNDYIWESKQERASALLTTSLVDFVTSLSAESSVKGINIVITRNWLSQYLDLTTLDGILLKYFELKTSTYNFAPFDVEYRSLFNEVINSNVDDAMRRSAVENRIMLMLEKFLNYLYVKQNELSNIEKVKLSDDEVKRLMEVESQLVKDFSTPPPTISFLCKVAAMSATTLKNKFKKLYGNNLYEYFQKNRMQRAKALLMSHKYSIKEIGSQLGYTNLSNFATAFKKEFDSLPSQLILQK